MKKEMSMCFLWFIVGGFLGTGVVVEVTKYQGHEWHKTIVKRGCGEYNSTTGKFQWKEMK